jgi:hypothetical protein
MSIDNSQSCNRQRARNWCHIPKTPDGINHASLASRNSTKRAKPIANETQIAEAQDVICCKQTAGVAEELAVDEVKYLPGLS